jgi:hypothetical protein
VVVEVVFIAGCGKVPPEDDLIYIVAINKQPLVAIRAVVFANDLPVVVIIVTSRIAGVNKVFFLDSSP